LQGIPLAPSTINQRLSAIRKLAREAGVTQGRIFLRIHKGGYVSGDRMSAQAVADVVRGYAERCGFGSLAKTSTS
jgi:hypothetical protein